MTDRLSLEEKATNYETMLHIQKVANNLNIIIRNLLERGEKHDASKLQEPEVEHFTRVTAKLSGLTYGSKEFDECKESIKPALDHHYANNKHHPEFTYFNNEEWKEVKNLDYLVSNYGRIKNNKGQILRQYITSKGYCRLQLSKKGINYNKLVHVLVAEAFIENLDPLTKTQVNHINCRKTDNKVSNLEWVTPSENLQHAYDNGLRKIKYVITCKELDITTVGCGKMETILKLLGYKKARQSTILYCLGNEKRTHLGLHFVENSLESLEINNSPICNMNIIDVVEMFCDWAASCSRTQDGDLRKSIEINAQRFNIDPMLVNIFENSVQLFE